MIQPAVMIFMEVVLSLIIILSILLNLLLVWFIIKQKIRLGFMRFKDKLITSLAISDMLRALVGYAFEMRVVNFENVNNDHKCDAPALIISFLSYTAIYHLALMTIDRWFFIARQRAALRFHFSTVRTSLALLFTWTISFLFAILPLLGFGSYEFEDRTMRCSVNWRKNDLPNRMYHVLMFLFCFFGPLFTIIFFYVKLRQFLRKSRRIMASFFEKVTVRAITKTRVKAEGRVTSMFFAMALVFIIAWCPYAVFSMINAFATTTVDINSDVQAVAVIPAKASTLFNPMVIAWFDAGFRRFLHGTLKCNKRACQAKSHHIRPINITN